MKKRRLKSIFFGAGSIGQRHIKNLISLGHNDIYIYEPNAELAKDVAEKHKVIPIQKKQIWKQGYDVAFITNPNSMHVSCAIDAARHGCDLFIEKPIATDTKQLSVLKKIVKEKKLVTIVGCNMRFHPGPKKVKELLDKGKLGRVLSAQVECGSFLPQWRPWQDYKKSYSARKDLGGGCVLDVIHEIDLACWYFGIPSHVKSFVYNTGFIGIECEDVADILMYFKPGFSCCVHLDYIQQALERRCKIVGERGIIRWDINEASVKYYDAKKKGYAVFKTPKNYDANQMYINEMKHFLECVKTRANTTLDVFHATDILNVALKAKNEKINCSVSDSASKVKL